MSIYEDLFSSASPPPARPSSAVVLWRSAPRLELFWVRRSPSLRFMGGWYAFPGGALHRSDREIPIEGQPLEWDPLTTTQPSPDPRVSVVDVDLAPGVIACALRELFEETGLLVTLGTSVAVDWCEGARRRLLEGSSRFATLLAEQNLRLTANRLVPAGRWRTPSISPIRFDNRFFLLEWSVDEPAQPRIVEGELVAGEWIQPAKALARWRNREVLIAPPILHMFENFEAFGSAASALPTLRDPHASSLGPLRRIETRPGIVQLPLATRTLPPATHTNCYLLGRQRSLIVDPGCVEQAEQERLLQALAAARDLGYDFVAVCLTHHHPDHVGAAGLLRDRLGIPVWAHSSSRSTLAAGGLEIDRDLTGGERLELSHDGEVMWIEVVHTPGHARGHICLYVENADSFVSGDLVSALSTMVIEPPEGDMDDYFQSLEAIRNRKPTLLFPGHGPLISNPQSMLDRTLAHRLDREQRIADAWRGGTHRALEIVDLAYDDLPGMLRSLAARQVEAHLERLRRRGDLASPSPDSSLRDLGDKDSAESTD